MTNPLLSPSPLPYGLPPFADIEVRHYAEAVEAGLAEHLAEIQTIVDDPEPATFENTALAMGRLGRNPRTGDPPLPAFLGPSGRRVPEPRPVRAFRSHQHGPARRRIRPARGG